MGLLPNEGSVCALTSHACDGFVTAEPELVFLRVGPK